MPLTIQLKPMTISNINATNNTSTVDRHLIRTASYYIAASMAPLAVMVGVAAMRIPAEDAGSTICERIGNSVTMREGRWCSRQQNRNREEKSWDPHAPMVASQLSLSQSGVGEAFVQKGLLPEECDRLVAWHLGVSL
ncbi:hypothetical protein [Synechococcus sp. BS56D]|uniref:hypothetical protein n=1 Tax=Synechococcus sp. BS56D TaxID=2055944 RepID=UPI0019D099A9|nr:hypothetical protein [Synechococcus sp. BS56D]